MAKRGTEESGPEKGKIRIFFAEVEGNNQSLQDALKTVVAAMNRPGPIATVRIPANGQTVIPTQAGAPQAQAAPEVVEEEVAEDVEESPAPARKRGTGARVDRNVGIKLVPNLDFRPDDKPALKTFFADKAPKTDMEQILVIGYYMQHMLDLSSFTPGHILTGLKEVGKPVPVDLKATIRNMRSQKVWLNFGDIEEIVLTTQGENHVEHELGASS